MGWVYLAVSVLAGVWFMWGAVALHKSVKAGGEIKPMKLFLLSNNYLALVCVGLSVDAVLGLQTIAEMAGF